MTASVLSFPSRVARPILQASPHGRGLRPYNFIRRVDPWHAPGVQSSGQGTICAADAAWLVEGVLGAPARQPNQWPGVPTAGAKAKAIAAEIGAYDYQQEGAAFLASRDYAILADSMGIGKTIQAIVAAEARLTHAVLPASDSPVVLVICPAISKRHWQAEIKKWTGHDSEVLEGLTPGPIPQARYIIANYDILSGMRRRNDLGVLQDSAEHPGWGATLRGQFVIAIFDEAHNLRGRASKRSKAVKDLLSGVPVVWLLTATPMPNHVRDLYGLVDIASDGLWGPSYWNWAKKYCGAHEGKYGWVDTGADCLPELGKRLSFFTLGRSKEAVSLQLPEKRRELYHVDVEMSAPTVRDAHAAQSKMQVVAKAVRATGRAKRSIAIQQTVEALEAKQKVVVFTYMREQAEHIGAGVKKEVSCTIFCVHGDQTADTRFEMAESFRNCAPPAAFVATMDSVGVSISLVGADLALFADLDYQPWKLLQSEGRVHRHGSTKRVLVRYLIATGTIDEEISDSVLKKLKSIEETLGTDPEGKGLTGMLAPDESNNQQVVDKLFTKLLAWGKEKPHAG